MEGATRSDRRGRRGFPNAEASAAASRSGCADGGPGGGGPPAHADLRRGADRPRYEGHAAPGRETRTFRRSHLDALRPRPTALPALTQRSARPVLRASIPAAAGARRQLRLLAELAARRRPDLRVRVRTARGEAPQDPPIAGPRVRSEDPRSARQARTARPLLRGPTAGARLRGGHHSGEPPARGGVGRCADPGAGPAPLRGQLTSHCFLLTTRRYARSISS